MNIRKQEQANKKRGAQIPSCSNCFACRKGTEYCPLEPNYDPEKLWDIFTKKRPS